MNNAAVTCQFYLLSHFRLAISITFRFGTPQQLKQMKRCWHESWIGTQNVTFITPHKVIVPTYGWTNKDSPPKNPSALSTTPWKYKSSTQKERSFQQPPFFKEASRLLVLGCVDSVQFCDLYVYHLERIEWFARWTCCVAPHPRSHHHQWPLRGGPRPTQGCQGTTTFWLRKHHLGGWLNQPLVQQYARQIHSLAG